MPAYNGEYEDALRPFLDAMRYKLAANKHKGRAWEEMELDWLFDRLKEETEELREAVARGNMVEIQMEAADIANFACMIAHKAMKEAMSGRASDGSRFLGSRVSTPGTPARPASSISQLVAERLAPGAGVARPGPDGSSSHTVGVGTRGDAPGAAEAPGDGSPRPEAPSVATETASEGVETRDVTLQPVEGACPTCGGIGQQATFLGWAECGDCGGTGSQPGFAARVTVKR